MHCASISANEMRGAAKFKWGKKKLERFAHSEEAMENSSPIVEIRNDGFEVLELRSVNNPARTRSNLSRSLSIGSFSCASCSLRSFNCPKSGGHQSQHIRSCG